MSRFSRALISLLGDSMMHFGRASERDSFSLLGDHRLLFRWRLAAALGRPFNMMREGAGDGPVRQLRFGLPRCGIAGGAGLKAQDDHAQAHGQRSRRRQLLLQARRAPGGQLIRRHA